MNRMNNKKNKKSEAIDKNVSNSKRGDKGDLKAFANKENRMKRENITTIYADGDKKRVHLNQRSERQSIIHKAPLMKNIMELKDISVAEKDQLCKISPYLKRIRDRYTNKLKTESSKQKADEAIENNRIMNVKMEKVLTKENMKNAPTLDSLKTPNEAAPTKVQESQKSVHTCLKVTKDKNDLPLLISKRKIKTMVTTNKNSGLNKAPVIGERTQKSGHLHIKIPNDALNNNDSEVSNVVNSTLAASRMGAHDAIGDVRKINKKYHRRCSRVTSRGESYGTKSPPTEVARWAPSSTDRHTKPYYEAWVNKHKTQLLNEDIFQLKSFTDSFARSMSPELVYANIADEKYTGRIKIVQK